MREFFYRRQDEMTQEGCTGVFACTSRGLHDHRRVGNIGSFHDGAHLLEVVDVEGRDAVATLGGVVQHLAHADQCHDSPVSFSLSERWGATRCSRMAWSGSACGSVFQGFYRR